MMKGLFWVVVVCVCFGVLWVVGCVVVVLVLYVVLVVLVVYVVYVIVQYGELKYLLGFKYFDYVNFDVLKGGMLVFVNLNWLMLFDKFNLFMMCGNVVFGIDMLFESFVIGSFDELVFVYGLLVDDIVVVFDCCLVMFYLNLCVCFLNGDCVMVDDVKFLFDMLKSKQVVLQFGVYFVEIVKVVVVDLVIVCFEFCSVNCELLLIVGGVLVFLCKWGLCVDGLCILFDQFVFEQLIGSGLYLIECYDNGCMIIYWCNFVYWGVDLLVWVGINNFEWIVYKLYGDGVVWFEVFKVGEYDVFVEYIVCNWMWCDVGKCFDSGEFVKCEFC